MTKTDILVKINIEVLKKMIEDSIRYNYKRIAKLEEERTKYVEANLKYMAGIKSGLKMADEHQIDEYKCYLNIINEALEEMK